MNFFSMNFTPVMRCVWIGAGGHWLASGEVCLKIFLLGALLFKVASVSQSCLGNLLKFILLYFLK